MGVRKHFEDPVTGGGRILLLITVYTYLYINFVLQSGKPTATHAVNQLLKMGKERPKHVELPK
jgi:hypothetical protein